jgi:type IV pilus assembly protein PilM
MPSLLSSFSHLFEDPPPELVFEISSDAVRMARVAEPQVIQTELLPPGTITPSPLHDNISVSEPLHAAVARLVPTGKGKRTAALLLPDHCAHVAVLDFDNFPDKADEQLALIRFRLKRSLPFDIDSAALSYWIQDNPAVTKEIRGAKSRREVVVAVTPPEIVKRYEAPFRAVGVNPGFVSLAPLACLDLADAKGIVAIARLSANVITILAKHGQTLRVIRSIELGAVSLAAIANHLHQTFVFIEDNLGAPAAELLLAGFGEIERGALLEFPVEFQMPVRVLGGADTGIRGYLRSFMKGAAA